MIEWNTGCLYTEEGQIIRADFVDDYRLAFYDKSRMIDGIIHGQFARIREEGSEYTIKEIVIAAYDRGIYMYDRTEDERLAIRALQG